MKNLIKLEERCKEIVGDKYHSMNISFSCIDHLCIVDIHTYKNKTTSKLKLYQFYFSKKYNHLTSSFQQRRWKYTNQLLEAVKEYVENDRNQS